jgi:exodeoxyribonuclease V alpha subunit
MSVGMEPGKGGKPGAAYAVVDFSGVEARYKPEEHDDLILAYAATVHKSQGCEFPVVIFAAPRAHRRMLNRNLFYTGVTRAKKEALVVGSRATVDERVRVADASRRNTGLRRRLRLALGLPPAEAA